MTPVLEAADEYSRAYAKAVSEMSDEAKAAINVMAASVKYDAKDVFFSMWAKHVGVNWDEINDQDRQLVMDRLNYVWARAVR